MSPQRGEAPDRNLALELVRVTEAGAMAAGRWVGRGDKEGGDGAAVDAMRELVNTVSCEGSLVAPPAILMPAGPCGPAPGDTGVARRRGG